MAISGHRTRAIFDRYNIASDEDLRQAVKQTTEHLATQPRQTEGRFNRKKLKPAQNRHKAAFGPPCVSLTD
jgi:hypothetical protein